MLFALGEPLLFVVLLASFLLAVVLRGVAQAAAGKSAGNQQPGREGRSSLHPGRHIDPFGTVAAVIAGVGWGTPTAIAPGWRHRPTRQALSVLAGPLTLIVAGVLVLAGYRAANGSPADIRLSFVLLGDISLKGETFPRVVLVVGCVLLACGLLALMPIPPLDGGQVLFALGPRSSGWQKADHYLRDQNWGVAVVLVLLLLPLAGRRPLLLVLLDIIGQPIVALVTGATG